MYDYITYWKSARDNLRKKDLEIIFKKADSNIFKNALEIGAGDGFQSKILLKYCHSIICTEYNAERLNIKVSDQENLKLIICDAEDLNFEKDSFDFIFSSNLLEHIKNKEKCLKGLYNVLKSDGIMIHTMPNRYWKLLNFILYYPYILYILSSKERRKVAFSKLKENSTRDNIKSKNKLWINKIFPPIHGENYNHFSEFINFGQNYWINLFKKEGFKVIQIRNLTLSSSYRFGFNKLRKLCMQLGFSSSYAYLIVKNSSNPVNLRYFI